MLFSINIFCLLPTPCLQKRIYVAHAKFTTEDCNKLNKQQQHTQQRLAVRQLCAKLLVAMQINDQVCESSYPYRLKNSGHIVSFSHSANHCAVVISDTVAGVDIEQSDIPWRVCQRFFCSNEIKLLEKLPSKKQQPLCKILWQAKECLIKIEQVSLASGMKVDFSEFIAEYLSLMDNDNIDNELYLTPKFIGKLNNANKHTMYINHSLALVVLF